MNLQEQINLISRVHQLIRLKATGTPKELAQRLEMSESTLYRLIDDMKRIGFPILYNKSRQTYCYEMEVRFNFEVCALEETEKQKTVGGKNFSEYCDFFGPLSFFESGQRHLCSS
jgi:predicted DNA-binding transcriptional regulator YafY